MNPEATRLVRSVVGAGAVLAVGLAARPAAAQSSSLFGDPTERRALALATDSWTYQALPPAREVQLNDFVTVLVDLRSQVVSQGQFNRQQQSSLDARLRDWLMLDKFDLGPQPQTTGDPRIQGSLTSRLQTNGDSQVRDSMTFEITTRVVDIRPNGTLVLEGRDEVRHNEELWRRSLTGECRREDIQPNNSISARKLYNVRVDKQEQGHVRDSVKRGWLLRAMDGFKPF